MEECPFQEVIRGKGKGNLEVGRLHLLYLQESSATLNLASISAYLSLPALSLFLSKMCQQNPCNIFEEM